MATRIQESYICGDRCQTGDCGCKVFRRRWLSESSSTPSHSRNRWTSITSRRRNLRRYRVLWLPKRRGPRFLTAW